MPVLLQWFICYLVGFAVVGSVAAVCTKRTRWQNLGFAAIWPLPVIAIASCVVFALVCAMTACVLVCLIALIAVTGGPPFWLITDGFTTHLDDMIAQEKRRRDNPTPPEVDV